MYNLISSECVLGFFLELGQSWLVDSKQNILIFSLCPVSEEQKSLSFSKSSQEMKWNEILTSVSCLPKQMIFAWDFPRDHYKRQKLDSVFLRDFED